MNQLKENKTTEPRKYSVRWAEHKSSKCKLCQRKRPNFCRRHSPRVTIEKLELFTREQVQSEKEQYLREFVEHLGKKYELTMWLNEDIEQYLAERN